MNEYELMTILSPRLNADETAATVHAIEARIAQHSGELLATDVWGRRRLAYPIGESMEGTYVLTTLRLPAASAAPLESWLTLSESVIRHLLIRGIIPYAGHDRERERDAERERERDAEPAGAPRAQAAEDSDGRDDSGAAGDSSDVDDSADMGDMGDVDEMDEPAADLVAE